MSQSKLHPEYLRQKALQDAYLARKNKKTDFYNGIYDRWENPVLTRESIPLSWRFDLDPETNLLKRCSTRRNSLSSSVSLPILHP